MIQFNKIFIQLENQGIGHHYRRGIEGGTGGIEGRTGGIKCVIRGIKGRGGGTRRIAGHRE